MKKILSKFISIFIVLAFITCMCPNIVRADSTNTTADGLRYSISNGCVTITGYDDNIIGTDVIIPDTIEGIPVTSIGNNAFDSCANLSNISISNNVTSIGDDAFYACSSLSSVTIPSGVTSIGNETFDSCSSLSSITILGNVTSIGDYAFESCKFDHITIPSTVTSIGKYAFNDCKSLTSITIPSGVKSISDYTFRNCNKLTSITIPDSVASIGDFAFDGCGKLANVNNDNILTGIKSIGSEAFQNCLGLTKLTFTEGLITIGGYAFNGCANLNELTIPDTVTTICNSAFYNTKYLANLEANNVDSNGFIVVGDSVLLEYKGISNKVNITNIKHIAASAFLNNNITSIVIPNAVTSIGDNAFDGCTKLTNITVPDSVTSIGRYTFDHCTGLENIIISNSSASIGDYAFTNTPSGFNIITYGSEGNNVERYAKTNNINCTVLASPNVKVETPTASISKTAAGEFLLTLSSATSGATVYYTTDASTPTESSTKYTTPITVNAGTIIKAIAVKFGMATSDVMVKDDIKLAIDTTNPTAGTVNLPYNFNFSSSGGSGSKVYSLEAGSLPSGLALATNGTLSGTPTSSGTFNFTIVVSDDLGQSSDYEYTMLVNNPAPPIPPTPTGITLNLNFTGQNNQPSTVNVPNLNITSSTASNGLKQYEFDLPESKVSEIENAAFQINSNSVKITDENNNSIGEVQFPSTIILQISFLNTVNTMFPVTINGNNNFPTKTYMANLNITTLGNNKHFNVSFTEASVPSVPTDVKAVAGNGCATVSFAPSASNGGFIAVNYVVTSNPGGITGTSTGDPVTITGLNNGTQYTFTVKAVNMIGESAESLPSNRVTPSEGLVISNVNPSNGTVTAPYTFNFSASGGFGSKVYSLESGSLPNGLTLAPNGTLFGTPTSAGTFNFKIKVTDNLGQTSDNSFTMVVNAAVPSAPTNVTASAGNGCAVVSFTPPSNNSGSPITSYKIISNTGALVGTGTASPITVTGLNNGVTYNFKVIAINSEGDSLPSAVSNNVTPSAPYTPPYIPPVPQPVTETRTAPVTAKVGNNEFTLGNVTVVRTINVNGTINDEVTLDESSISQIIANAVKDNAASVDIILNDSVSSKADSIGFQADGNCTKLLQENKLSLNVETAKGSISLPYATLKQLTGMIVQGTFSEILDSRTPSLISEYAAGAKQIGTSLKLDTNFSGAAEFTIPITADELQKGNGNANFLSNLAVMVQHSDGENEVVTGTIVYDSNNKPVGVKIPVKKFSTFTLIELQDSINDGDAKVIPYKVNSDKVWTVNFSNGIDKTTVNKDNVYVLDDEGNKVDVKLEVNGKALTISPVENYKSGHKYHLYITDKVQSVNKKTLKKALEYEFNVI